MPRPERPLDRADSALGQFAADLRGLREKAGSPSYRELSRIAHYSATVLSEAAGGRKLPSLAVTLAYVRGCAGDVDEWRQRWHEVSADLAGPASTGPAECPPYLGLTTFQPTDVERFFGRDRLLEDVRGRLAQRRLVGVFGASGSGKSSLLRAGLVASSRDQPTMVFTPGPRPREECALRLAELVDREAPALLADLAGDPASLHLYLRQVAARGGADVLVVVDQFEEIFTQCADQGERDWFVAALVRAATAPTSQARVVLGVRADFYGQCGNYPELVEALRDAQVLVGVMTADELRQVISGPAARAGCTVETALVSRLIAEATGQPAVLPLVSHALLETWRHRRGTRLTLAGYEETGGLEHAIARTAESVCDELDPGQLAAARQLFLRLTAVVDGVEDTKRRLAWRELDASDANTAVVVERFADARLLTLDADTVQLSHEAIIRCWPRLREWLQDDLEGRRLHRHLTDATESWESIGEDAGALYRSTRLARARDWAAANPTALTSREQRFLDASLTAEAAEHVVARRRTRRLRQLVAGLTALLLVAAVAVGYAVRADQAATDQRDLAVARNAVDGAASLRAFDPALSVQLSLAAYRLAPNPETRDALLSTFGTPYGTRLAGHTADVNSVAFGADSHLLATASSDGSVRLWRVDDPHRPRMAGTIPVPKGSTPAVAFAGRVLAVAGDDAVGMWEVSDPDHPRKLPALNSHHGTVFAVAFDRDGAVLAAGNADQTATLWNVRDPAAPRQLTSAITSGGVVALSPDGRLLATSEGATGARLWNISDPTAPQPLGALVGHRNVVAALAFGPDGHTLASGGYDLDVRLWDIGDPGAPRTLAVLTGNNAIVWSLAFSPDGHTLASTGSGTRLWDVADPHRAAIVLTLPAGQTSAAFSPDGTALVANSGNHNALVYALDDLPLTGHHAMVDAAAYTRDGGLLATGSWDDTVRLWDVTASGQRRALATLAGQTGFVRGIALSSDRRLLAAASDDGTVWLWNIADPHDPHHVGTARHAAGEILSVAFTADGRTMATAGIGTVQLWDITDATNPVVRSRLGGYSGDVWAVLISPDGLTLITGNDIVSRLWDISDTSRPRQIPFRYSDTDTVQPGAFSPDGRLLATISAERTVRLLDMADPRQPRQLATITGYGDVVSQAVFSPDGRRLATGDADATARLLDIGDPGNPRELGVFSGPTGDGVVRVVFSPDGHTLAGGGYGGVVHLWPTDIDQVIARICAVAHPRITESEWNQYFPGEPYLPPC